MAYTRSKYIHSRPQIKIRRFTMGDAQTDYKHAVCLIAPHPTKIGGCAIESARIAANKVLEAASGVPYLLKVAVYPHEIVREHRLMGFAGADRLSQGMTKSFGKAKSLAARVGANQAILVVYVNEDGVDVAKASLKRASKKLPVPCKILVREA
jgi:large subunit ribosomal protein L10e